MTLHIISSAGLSLLAVLKEPFLIAGIAVPITVGAAHVVGGQELLEAVVMFWFSIPVLLVVALSAATEPVKYVPRSILTAEISSVGQFLRSGFGLLLGAVVVSLSTIAVQADLSGGIAQGSQIGELIAIIVVLGVTIAVWRYSFQLFLTQFEGRKKAVRKVAAFLVVWSGPRRALRGLGASYFKSWQDFLAAGAWLWAAGITVPLVVIYCATRIAEFFI